MPNSIWTRINDEKVVYIKKEHSEKIFVKIYMRDARFHYMIGGRVGTKYENFIIRNQHLARQRRGWKSLHSAKERALTTLRFFDYYFKRSREAKQRSQ